MIIKQLNDDIKSQISNGHFKVHNVSYIQNRERLNITLINHSNQTFMKLGLTDPQFSNDDFELNDAIVTNLILKNYHKVFNSKYFTVSYLELKEKGTDKTVSIKDSEVFVHDEY